MFKLCLSSVRRVKRNKFFKCNYCSNNKTATSEQELSVQHVSQLFKQHNLRVIQGHACLITDCALCKTTKKEAKLYIDKNLGSFICDKCKYTGSWSVLKTFLSTVKQEHRFIEAETLKTTLKMEQNFGEEWSNLQKDMIHVADLPMTTYQEISGAFSFPCVPQKMFELLECFCHVSSKTLYFPLIGLNNAIVGYKAFQYDGTTETFPKDACGCILYKPEKYSKGKTVIIVKSIQDLMALTANKIKQMVICIPYDLKCLSHKLLPMLETYTKLILWIADDDVSNINVMKNLAKMLGEQRCYVVRPASMKPYMLPKAALDMGFDISAMLNKAYSITTENITSFEAIKHEVFLEFKNANIIKGIQWTRFPILNKLLKGHRKGELTIITGPTGCGKTTFASEYSLDLAMQGVNTLWGSFEIKHIRLIKTMLQQFAGYSLTENLHKFDDCANAFSKLPIFFMVFHGQQQIDLVLETIQHAKYIHNIEHVLIDNMQFMMGVADKNMDRYYRQDVVISKFRQYATSLDCHITLIIHPRKERPEDDLTSLSIFGTAKVSQEADNILIIQDKRLSSPRGKKYLQITKNRFSGDLGIMPLEFNPEGLSYAQKHKEKTGEITKMNDNDPMRSNR